MPGQVIDLDAVVVERVTIRKTVPGETVAREWDLRDDIEPAIMLRVFRLMGNSRERATKLQDVESTIQKDDVEGLIAATDAVEREFNEHIEQTLDILLAIFQHTYPDTTADELRRWFTVQERQGLVQLFFTRQLQASSTPSSAITPTNPPNRAARRARKSSGSGAIPSQKRLSRELKGL